ncbi:MAG TPA: AMP-binding protein [Actinomycetales bacterium]|nr:AMP-binding protein [Actinomycetales bacterium]
MDVGTLVTRAAARWPDRIAVEGPDSSGTEQQLTFSALGERVVRLANGLRHGLGLQPGDRVLDLQTNTTTYLETDLAIRAARLVRVALNYRLHPSDWQRIATDCGAAALVHHVRFSDDVAPLVDQVGAHRVVVTGASSGTPRSYEDLLARGSTATLPAPSPDAFCGLHYSSGTTGHPKGAQRTHRNWFASVVNMTHDVLGGPPAGDSAYCHAGPITHTSGLFVLPFLVAGARQLILPGWDPDVFADAVVHRGVTHTAMVPTMVSRLAALATDPVGEATLAQVRERLRMLGYAGAPMPAEQIRQAHALLTPNLVQYYGLVEAIPPVTVLDAADHAAGLGVDGEARPDLLTSAGRPALGVELRVVQPDDPELRPLAPGEVGEVCTRGDHVMAGYWNAGHREDLGKAVVDGWLRTGDLGRLDDAGRLWLVDRKGDMIITGGYNVYPREVEEVVAEVPGVGEVAVLGVADPDWGQQVVAVYTVRDGRDVSPDAVIEHCRSRMASYKKPKVAHRVDAFPLNSTGKIAKRVLRDRLEAGLAPDEERV